jgi:hypothetical protein
MHMCACGKLVLNQPVKRWRRAGTVCLFFPRTFLGPQGRLKLVRVTSVRTHRVKNAEVASNMLLSANVCCFL